MKKVLLLVLSLGLLFTTFEKESDEAKTVPIKGELQSHVTEALNGIPVYGTLSGNILRCRVLLSWRLKTVK
jgi:hypothetical protein